jgi:DNA-binding transcriptional LysR family regulator
MKEPIDSRQLRAFVTLVNTGSFTQTAKQLFLSQSAISHSIKELVKLGLGISAMAPWTVRGELRQKTLVTLPLGKKKIATQLGPPASSRQKTHAGGGNVCDVEPIHLHLVC